MKLVRLLNALTIVALLLARPVTPTSNQSRFQGEFPTAVITAAIPRWADLPQQPLAATPEPPTPPESEALPVPRPVGLTAPQTQATPEPFSLGTVEPERTREELPKEKPQVDPQQPPAPAGSGQVFSTWPGPDGYDYWGSTCTYDWVDITTTGTPVTLSDDDYDGPFNVGFNFPFYDDTWTQFYVSSNGHMDFGSGSTDLSNDCPLPSVNTPDNIIALMWDDLDPGDTGDLVYYERFASCPVGSGQCLVVQYENYHHYPGGGAIAGTFEAILYEDGTVVIQFEDAGDEEGSGSTTGIEGDHAAAGWGLTYACNTASSLSDNLCIQFERLEAPNFSGSYKTADYKVEVGKVLTYTVYIHNTGVLTAENARLVDPIPADTAFARVVPPATYNPVLDQIEWNGTVLTNTTITVTFAVTSTDIGAIINTATIFDPQTPAPVEVSFSSVAYPAGSLYWYEDFEANDGGFVGSCVGAACPLTPDWEWGKPDFAYGPDGAHKGANVWGTNLTGDYSRDSISDTVHVLTGTLDLTGVPVTYTTRLQWWHWNEIRWSDAQTITISSAAGTDVLWSHSGSYYTDWEEMLVDVPARHMGQVATLRFELFTAAGTVYYAGWYVDDLAAHITPPLPVLETSSKKASGSKVEPGQALTYTVYVRNTGDLTATGTVMTDSIPPGVTYTPGGASASDGTITDDPTHVRWDGDVGWYGGVVTITIPVIVGATDECPTAISNTAAITHPLIPDTVTVRADVQVWDNIYYFEDFEADAGGYTASGTNSSWDWGAVGPYGGIRPDFPDSAHAGTNAWATNLTGDYNNYEDGYLTSPPIDLGGIVARPGYELWLQWWDWFSSESCCDFGIVEARGGAMGWTPISAEFRGLLGGWAEHMVDISAFAGVNDFQVRFYLHSDLSVVYPGWYVDDVAIHGCQPPPLSIAPDYEYAEGCAGWVQPHERTLFNLTGVADIFNLTYDVSPAGGGTCNGPATIGPLIDRDSADFTVVLIPSASLTPSTTVACTINALGQTSAETATATIEKHLAAGYWPEAWNDEDADLGTMPANVWGSGDGIVNYSDWDTMQWWTTGGVVNSSLSSQAYTYDWSTGTWEDGGSMPQVVYRTEGDVQNNDVYNVGGSSGGFTPQPHNQHYSGTTWLLETPMPGSAMDIVVESWPAAFGGNDHTYVVGGYGLGGAAYEYDPDTDTWTTLTSNPFATIHYPVDGCFGWTDRSGGSDPVIIQFPDTTSAQTNLLVYHIAGDTWEEWPVPGGFPASGIWAPDIANDYENNLCYVTGGADIPGPGNLTSFYIYDPAHNTVQRGADFTTARDFHASWYHRPLLCVGAGNSDAAGDLNSTQCIEWTECGPYQEHIELTPEYVSFAACADEVQTHTLTLRNMLLFPGTFDLEYDWSGDADVTGPATAGPLDIGFAEDFDVLVTPHGPPGSTVVITVTAWNSSHTYSATAAIEKHLGWSWWELMEPVPVALFDWVVESAINPNDGLEYTYIAGGNVLNTYRYDPRSDTWATMAGTTPDYLYDAGDGVAYDGHIYARTDGNAGMTGYLFDYDIVADAWSANAVPITITDRMWYEAVELDGWIYFMGGSDAWTGSTTAEVDRYNPATGEWQTVAPMNYSRALAMSWSHNGMIYVAGGFDDAGDLASTEVYSPALDAWIEDPDIFAPLPHSWWGAGDAIKHGDQLWLAGGYNTAWTADTLWWGEAHNMWHAGSPLAEVVSQVEMDNQLGELYAVGGYRGEWLDFNQHLVQCDVPTGYLEGYVYDGETDGTDPPCRRATVHLEPGDIDVSVKPDGHYIDYLAAYTYTATASAPGYADDGPYPVVVEEGATTIQDLPLYRPLIAVTPTDLISVTGVVSVPVTYDLTIENTGHVPLEYRLQELPTRPGGMDRFAAVVPGAGRLPPATTGTDPLIQEQMATAPDGKAGFFVAFADTADLTAAYGITDRSARGRFVVQSLQAATDAAQARVRAWLEMRDIPYQVFWINNTLYIEADEATLNALAAFPEVAGFRGIHTYHVLPVEMQQKALDETLSPQAPWNVSTTGADQVWADFDLRGEGIVAGGIDSGVDYDHIGLVQNYRGCLDPPNCTTFDHTYSWYDPLAECPNYPEPCDTDTHGTQTHGIMTGDDDPALPDDAWIGMAPNAKFIHCMGLSYGSGSDLELLMCAMWMLAPGGDPDMRPHVVNNSWGSWAPDLCDNWYATSIAAWRAADIFPAFAAGNVGDWVTPPHCNSSTPPANSTNARGVPIAFASGAHGSNDLIDYYSSGGPNACSNEYIFPNVASPGLGSCTTYPGDGYTCGFGGTSSASPHTAGCVALVRQANPYLTVAEVERAVMLAADDPTDPDATNCGGTVDYNNIYGHGLLDCYEAVESVYIERDIPWVWTEPVTGTVDSLDSFDVQVTFHCSATGEYSGTLRVLHNDPCTDRVGIPLLLQCHQVPVLEWQKVISIDGEVVTGTTFTVWPGDTVQIVDRVRVTHTSNVAFTLVEAWTESLNLTGWISDTGGTALAGRTLTWEVQDAAPNAWYAITKTFHVEEGEWEVDLLTETLEVEYADPQPEPMVLEFVHGCVEVSGTDFTYAPTDPEADETVTFTGTVTAGMPPITYTWDFSDDGTGSGRVVTHTFPATITEQTYTVTLTAANGCPSQQVVEKTVTVQAPLPPPPLPIYLPLVLRNH